jgi:predicted Zn-dependent protease
MSAKDLRSKSGENWEKKESAGRFLRDVVIVAVVLAGAFIWYQNRTKNAAAANALAKEAKDLVFKNNPADLDAAAEKLKEVLAKYDAGHGYSLATLAELDAIAWGEQKVSSRKANAEQYAAQAEKAAPNLAQTYSAKALVMVFDGKAKEAEDFLNRNVIEKGAGDSRIFAALGQAQRAQGKLEEARRSFKAAFDSDWRDPRFAELIGESYLEEGDAANALAYFMKGVGANSEHYGCQIGAARARIMRGEQLKEASDSIAKALAPEAKLTPRLKARALVAQAELRTFEMKFDEAVDSAQKASEADPSFAWAYRAKAAIKAVKGDAAGAAADFDKAIDADRNVAAFYFDASGIMARTGDGAKAIAYLERYPLKKDDRFFVRYGDVLRAVGRDDEALVKYDEAIKENETNADAYLAKAIILIGKKQLDDAQAALDTAIVAREFFPDAYVQRAKIQFEKKEYETALQEYAKAIEQWSKLRTPKEKLTGEIDSVKNLLIKAGEKDYAKAWETQMTALIN